MPDMGKLISNLHHRRIGGLGDRCGGGNAMQEAVISEPHRLIFGYSPISTELGTTVPPRLNCRYNNAPGANGKYIHYAEGWSYAADLDRNARTVASGDYLGCQYSVFKLPGGVYRCVHTSRPLNPDTDRGDDTYVVMLATYARRRDWQVVHTFHTAGLRAISGCSGVFTVTRVSYTVVPEPVVRTVRLELDGMGRIIRSTRFTDGNPPEVLP